ncbi:phospholipase D-like domain-containing protein [Terrimonas sp. NA20]|uniref:Phospholipase D-like domain-containing protein n=1 Tax=Terrimonas ginsenosidimutans TaxID=2908004 RepID=A0ABS9KTV9_9BACT|nr:phospholipase D-like domain-containing protein [Terrimonas ginsenosidimutans]MCG2615779.1 phospholipase D-like domain-containing protein [Terrimonas ginsenosidimutans]
MSTRYTPNNNIKLVHSGSDFFDTVCRMVDSARHTIHLQTYILGDDTTGTRIVNCLIAAAKRNVQVYVLADGYASQDLSEKTQLEMKDAGINFRFFEPLIQSRHLYFGRRLHHKIIVTDARFSLVGGLNIADRYNDLPDTPAWLDVALFTDGSVSAELHKICEELWAKKRRSRKRKPDKHSYTETDTQHHISVRVRRNDWVKRKQEITRTYTEVFRSAQHSITIVCAYFLPGTKFRQLLKKAAARGVKIRVVMASISDVPVSKYAERYLYRWMLRHHFELYEYQPTVLHAKMAIADDEFLTIGSYNINNISRYASIELNLDVKDNHFVNSVSKEIEQIITEKCIAVTSSTYKTKLFSVKQFFQWSAFQMVRMMMTVSTFYFRQRE